MTNSISLFFDAWETESDDERLHMITRAVIPEVEYTDPRTPDTITGVAALGEYVAAFSANAPGWSARVVGSDSSAGVTRATVAFGGKGADGADVVQLGQYFVEMKGELIARMVGFVGTGAQG